MSADEVKEIITHFFGCGALTAVVVYFCFCFIGALCGDDD